MKLVRKMYIEFLHPGVHRSMQRVKTRDTSKVKVPETAYGFKFFDILSAVVDVDGEKVRLTSKWLNVSPMHYYGGKLYTISELKREFSSGSILIDNFKCHEKIIRCRTGMGNWQPFEKTDIFIEEVKS